MAPPALAQVGFEPAEGPFDSKNGDCGPDDWVSLILSDVDTDAEANNAISVPSLSSLPLPDLDDLDFSNLDGSVSSHVFCSSLQQGPLSHPELFDPSEILQSTEMRPSLYQQYDKDSSDRHAYACPSFSDFCSLEKENAISQSPESGISHVSTEYPDADASIHVMDSCSDEDSFYFLVSDICSEETSSTGPKPCNTVNATIAGDASFEQSRANGTQYTQIDNCSLQTSSSQQDISMLSEKIDMFASKRDISRKRKHLDRTSRSSTPEGMSVDCPEKLLGGAEVKDEEDEKRQARLIRNRESAHLSRQRKKLYVDKLEEKIKTMASTIAELNNTINLISAENINLRRQLGMFGPPSGQAGGQAAVAPWMCAYPPGSMVNSRFMVPGSQVPLVPIPKWKSQQATTIKKTRKPKPESQDKGTSEKAAKKTKKVAGVAAAGLFFFMFMLLPFNFQILGLRPIMQRESKVWPTAPLHMEATNVVVRAGGRVLTGLNEDSKLSVDEQGSGMGYTGSGALTAEGKDLDQELERCNTTDLNRGDHRTGYKKNASIPLAATLFVPKNDQLIRIEGNLIINSVLAGNKAADFLNQTDKQSVKTPALYDRSLALNANLKAVALKAAPEEKRALVELQRALAGRLRFDLDGGDIKAVREDGSLQQWFVEDFTGPIFSSGMCTEVFQFETSPVSTPSSGSASHVTDTNDLVKNKTAWIQDNGPRKAGRSSYAVPLPPAGQKILLNATPSNHSFSGAKGGYGTDNCFAKQKLASSSVVVSVLAGPELGEHSKLIGGRKLSRIFVVVLIDSIKYVTYSCILPSTAAKAHYEVVVP